MKILFIIQQRDMPSSRVRILNLVPKLEENGISCTVKEYPRTLKGKLALFIQARSFDAVLLQKKLPSPVDVILLKRFSRKLLFDFDDAIHLHHDSEERENSRSREVKARAILSRADLVIAGNRILQEYARRYNANVEVVPSCVDSTACPTREHRAANGPLVIGWVGGRINLAHLQLMGNALRRLSERHDLVVHVVCDRTLELPGVTVKHIPWSLETQHREICRFDIGIMPLPPSKHAEGKCGYKALQCMAAGVPVVVSDVGINRDIVTDGQEGFVVPDEEGFEQALDQLIRSLELRAAMGARARKKIEEGYSIEYGSHRLAACIKSCVEGRDDA
jgi:glycosyltransferase involved in cell wall biosynthesis